MNFLTLINNRLTLTLSKADDFFCNVFCPNIVTPCYASDPVGSESRQEQGRDMLRVICTSRALVCLLQ